MNRVYHYQMSESLNSFGPLMQEALLQARLAGDKGEVPVGAVISRNGEIIAKAHNRVEELHDPTAHAELLAIREASQKLANWRLPETVLCVTLEPCAMCVGAMRLARIPLIVYGAGDSRFGALGSACDLSKDPKWGPPPTIIPGISAGECRELLRSFFQKQRAKETQS